MHLHSLLLPRFGPDLDGMLMHASSCACLSRPHASFSMIGTARIEHVRQPISNEHVHLDTTIRYCIRATIETWRSSTNVTTRLSLIRIVDSSIFFPPPGMIFAARRRCRLWRFWRARLRSNVVVVVISQGRVTSSQACSRS